MKEVSIKDTPAENPTDKIQTPTDDRKKYDILTAPMDLTQEDIQERGSKGRKDPTKKRRQGTRCYGRCNPKSKNRNGTPKVLRAAELMEIIEERGLTKTGTKAIRLKNLGCRIADCE